MRYPKFLVKGAANIGDIPESIVVIPVSRPSDTNFWEVSGQRPLSFSVRRISLALGNLRDKSILSLH